MVIYDVNLFTLRKEVLIIRLLVFVLPLLLIFGCASYGVIRNTPQKAPDYAESYSIRSSGVNRRTGDISMMLAFSGGGTRAAAFAYGVLQELRDTDVVIEGRSERLLDEVDTISSVSGGSFTSAYYGLYGDQIFDDFETVFLRHDIEGALIRGVLSPLQWFKETGRTEMAIGYYEEKVFHGATFADMKRKGGPLILINASDLAYGVRFSFVQEYFNLLCSDLSSFPVARAVTASSAVPVLFNPVVVENYQDCKETKPDWLMEVEKLAAGDPELVQVVDGLQSYFLKDKRKYAHFVDGGITDNLGLRAVYEAIEISGGPKVFLKKLNLKPPSRIVIITVNASTDPAPKMDASNKQPSLSETINSVTDIQLHRYNTATLKLMKQSVNRWAKELSTPERPVTPYFIQISFRDIQQSDTRVFFNRIPTSFSVSDEQVDRLIAAGRELLRNNPDFQRFVADLDGD
jgi:NTE family protein